MIVQNIIISFLAIGAIIYLANRFYSAFKKDSCDSGCGCAAAEIREKGK